MSWMRVGFRGAAGSWCLAAFVLVFGCLVFRVLDVRPMHHDEANQAYSARRLLDFHGYAFKPSDHHGPTLYYALLPVAWARGQFHGLALDETTVRLVPLLAACGVLLLPVFLGGRLGRGSGGTAALLLGLSPCFVYYSTYFVQEMLLVLFLGVTFLGAFRWLSGDGRVWAAVFGAGVGLCVATKETWVLSAAAACAAAGGTVWLHRGPSRRLWAQRSARLPELGPAVWTAGVIWLVLFTSFGTHWQGAADFFRCWVHYFEKGTSERTAFAAPFGRYAEWLFRYRSGASGPVWSEWLIGAGWVSAVLLWRFPRLRPAGMSVPAFHFLSLYSVVLPLLYSCISYKTPWCALGMAVPMAWVAGMAVAGVLGCLPRPPALAVAALLGVAGKERFDGCVRTVTRYSADPRNPWAYAHTQRDYLRLVSRLRGAEALLGRSPRTLVLTDYIDHWPLPWYTYETDAIEYMDFRGWGAEPEKDERIRRSLAGEPDFILCRMADVGSIPGSERYFWEDVTLRPNVLLRLGSRRANEPAAGVPDAGIENGRM